MLIAILSALAACTLSFVAGLTWRNRRHERFEEMRDQALMGIGERVAAMEKLLKLSSD